MTDEKTNALIYRPASGLSKPDRGSNPILRRITQDVLTRAQDNRLSGARFRVGGYLLREPDYRQILRWSDALGMPPEEVLETLAEIRVQSERGGNYNPITFGIEDGAIVSLAWDFRYMPLIPVVWERGMLIRDLGFCGDRPGGAIGLCPVLARLQTLVCEKCCLRYLDLSQVPQLTTLFCGANFLSQLNLSQVVGLTELCCSDNELTELNLLPVPRLTKINCTWNQITMLDLASVRELTRLSCYYNRLTELDLTSTPKLTHLACDEYVELINSPPKLVISWW